VLSVLIGVVIVIVAVVEWLAHVSVIHALAILTGLVGVSLILGGIGERGGRWTRL
jgi:hypothetical protein